jgi:hypothetical protein
MSYDQELYTSEATPETQILAGGGENIVYDDPKAELDLAGQRIQLGEDAGNVYINKLESIRDELDATDNSGTTLGTMVSAQLKMTEAETEYMVRAGVPKKASSSVGQAAQDVKKAAG